MSLKQQLSDDMKTALKAGDKGRLSVIRMALAAVKQIEVDSRQDVDDAGVLQAIEKMVKQRRDSIKQFESAGRSDLVEKEAAELEVLKGYLPEQLSPEALGELIEQIIASTGASGPGDMGKVMGALKSQAGGRVDMGAASGLVRQRLQSA